MKPGMFTRRGAAVVFLLTTAAAGLVTWALVWALSC